MPLRHSRRDFLRTGALLTLPAAVYRGAFAADPPSERIRLGFIGVGNQGKSNLRNLIQRAPVVALCDVDAKYLAAAADFVEKGSGKPPATFGDYRKLLDSKDVDAVVVTTPDHWHALMTIDACEAGKDVYCEKPLTLTIDEGKAMVAAARNNKRIVQTGSQQRSANEFRTACELVRNGAVGKLHTVKVGLPKPNWVARAKEPVPDSEPPAELDYDLWLGPAPKRPYNEKRVHYLFRFFWDYSGGQQTNFGAHDLDITQWALGMDESGPVSAEGVAKYHPQGWYETPDWTDITYRYANGVTVKCGQGYPGGCTFEGDRGTIHVKRGKLTADQTVKPTGDVKLYHSDNHHRNWLECIKTRKLPICDVAIGHRSATVCHLGNIAIRLGRKITWDPAKEEIVGDTEAAKWTTKEYRAPWKLV
jgi:predicted dehydrogenase